jgi:signal transduction histidine kinase
MNNRIDVQLYTEPVYDVLSEEKMINIYRIVQEGLNNAIKHSGATEIHIHLSRMEDHINLTISDNGAGFDFSLLQLTQQPQDKGIGLKNIHNRVLLLGGKLYINSKINYGTQLIAEIPV